MHIQSTNKKGEFITDKYGQQLIQLIEDLGWDADRFSSSGQDTYGKITELIYKKYKHTYK